MHNKRFSVNRFSFAIAAIAWVLIFLFRSTVPGEGLILWLQPIASLALAGSLLLFSSRATHEKSASFTMLWFAAAGLIIPLVIGSIERSVGVGSPWEILTLLAFANWTLCMAMLSRFQRFQNLTAIFAGAGVFVVISMVEETAPNGWVFSLLAISYGLLVLWWSMTNYWQRLEQKFADENRSELSVRATVFLVSLLGMVVLGGILAVFASTRFLDIRGISWFSGGDRFSDEYARSGTGEGDGIRAATHQAHTFGPVDSEIYLESRQPSLYDVSNEFYGHPQKIRQSRAIAIAAETTQTQTNRTYRNQRASSEFSVARKPRVSPMTNPGDELVSVLFHYKGRVPEWLAMETYNDFEDGHWQHLEPTEIENRFWHPGLPPDEFYRSVDFQPQFGAPWMKVQRHGQSPLFGSWNYGAVKVINLRSLRIPAPAGLEQLYIDKIDKPDFFLVGSDDIPRLNSNSAYIPPDTVIHLLAARPNVYPLIMAPDSAQASLSQKLNKMEPYLNSDFVPPLVAERARQWTISGKSPWEKIELITKRLRNEFQLDRDAVLSEEDDDPALFLLNEGVGNDYMFASTANFMFRSLGIPSRVVKGFYADPRQYDPKTGHTGIVGTDIHVWVEVCLDGEFWIPVEPSPGYAVPKYHLDWWQTAVLAGYRTWRWIVNHPIASLLLASLAFLVVWNYRKLLDQFHTLVWRLNAWLRPNRVLLDSARLIDRRSRLAGIQRPISMTPARFSLLLAQELKIDTGQQEVFDRFVTRLDRALYHPQANPLSNVDRRLAYQDCRSVLLFLPFKHLNRFSKLRNKAPI